MVLSVFLYYETYKSIYYIFFRDFKQDVDLTLFCVNPSPLGKEGEYRVTHMIKYRMYIGLHQNGAK